MSANGAGMRRPILLAGLAPALLAAEPAAATPARRYIDVALVTQTASPAPGRSFWIGLRMIPKPGWHGYWSNPGGSGLAPKVKWEAPPTLRFGPLEHPAPTLLRVSGITSYVHAGPHVLLSRVTLASDVPLGTNLPITAHLTWAACSDRLCVPEQATISVALNAGDAKPGAEFALLKRAAMRLPRHASPGTFAVADGEVSLELPSGLKVEAARLRFFPDRNGFIDAGDLELRPGHRLGLVAPMRGSPPSSITGVLSDGVRAYRLTLSKNDPAAPGSDSRRTIARASPVRAGPGGIGRRDRTTLATQAASRTEVSSRPVAELIAVGISVFVAFGLSLAALAILLGRGRSRRFR